MVRPTKQIRGRRDDTSGWWQRLNSLSVQGPTRRKSASQDNFPTKHLRRHTHTTALGPPVKKNVVRLPYLAGLSSKRSIAILSALRYCQSWEVQNTVFFIRRNINETVMVEAPLDVLKQYFGIFVKMGL